MAYTRKELIGTLIDLAVAASKGEICTEFHFEGTDRVCDKHDYQWNEADAVCNAVQGSIEDITKNEF